MARQRPLLVLLRWRPDMAGLLDWLNDTGIFGGGPTGGTPMQPGLGGQMGDVNPMGDATGGSMPLPTPAPAATQPMPPVQMTGQDAPLPQGGDPMSPDMGTGAGPGLPVPMPKARPPEVDAALPPNAAPTSGGPPGQPLSIAPPGNGTNGVGPGLGVAAPKDLPGQTWLGRAFNIKPDQAGLAGRETAAGLAAGLKAIGQGAGVGQGKFAAFAGGMGNAMEGAQKEKAAQGKQMNDYLKSAIDAKKAGDEAGYKRNYLQYLKAKLQADTDKAASKDAGTNKNDTPTQLYLSAERLVQADPQVRDASKALAEARENGTPEEVAKAQATMQQIIAAKQAQHYGALGLNPKAAAEIAKQPGNSRDNPVDAGKLGITKDNIGQKLQPGQYFTNPSDGQVYQYKGPPKGEGKQPSGKMPDKPTNPEPPNPLKPYKTPAEGGGDGSSSSSDEGED